MQVVVALGVTVVLRDWTQHPDTHPFLTDDLARVTGCWHCGIVSTIFCVARIASCSDKPNTLVPGTWDHYHSVPEP